MPIQLYRPRPMAQRPPPAVYTGVEPGMQRMGIRVATTIVSCEAAGCSWFLNGSEGMDEGAPYVHPAGVRCGDSIRCKHPNCPCPRRLVRERGADGRLTGRQGHKVQDVDRGPAYIHNTGGMARQVSDSEWTDRLHEGVDALIHIRKHGL